MGKSKPKAPAAPDPTQVANAQAQANKDTAIANAALNRVNQITPWGSLTYTQDGVDANGIPKYTQNINLSPEQQKLLNTDNQISQSLSDLGLSQLGSVRDSLNQPFSYAFAPRLQSGGIQTQVDMSGVPALVSGEALNKDLQTQRDALYRQQAAFLDPQYKNDQSDLENKLIQQGITQNSDAWNRATGDFNRNKEFAYSNARNSAITGGGAEQSRLFGLGLAARQNAYSEALNNAQFANSAQAQGFGQSMAGRNQFVNEQNYLRQQPLNELNALRTGSQVSAPQFNGVPQSVVNGQDVSGLYNNQYQSQLANYNAQVSGNNALTGGLFGLGAAALSAPSGSWLGKLFG